MINVVALVLNALQTADLPAYAEIPDPPPDPVMRVEENGAFGPSSLMPDHLYELDLELQTWGSTKSLAYATVSDALDVLRSRPSNQHGAVTRAELVGNQYLRDSDTLVNGQPSPRYVTVVRLHVHP